MNSRRVVVTGIGAISCLGHSVEETWKALIEGKCGIGPVTRFDTSAYRTHIAGEVRNFDPTRYMSEKEARRLDDFCLYAIAAGDEALKDAGLGIKLDECAGVDPNRVGVCVGSGIGGMRTMEEQCKVLIERGPSRISPFLIPMMIIDMASGSLSMRYGAKGPNMSNGEQLHRRVLLDGQTQRCGYHDYRWNGSLRLPARLCRILLDESAQPEK